MANEKQQPPRQRGGKSKAGNGSNPSKAGVTNTGASRAKNMGVSSAGATKSMGANSGNMPANGDKRGTGKQKPKLRIIPLGGLGEIGKNLTVIEYENDIMIVDCGMAFPDDELLGVDLVIPDITYLKKNKNKVRGIVITHGHEDHIGAIPYVLKELSVPIYCTKLTAGIVETRLVEHRMSDKVQIILKDAGDTFQLGRFKVEMIRVNHSVAHAVALAITTPLGVLIHTGDFKIDMTPVMGEMIDLTRFGQLGREGVLVLMSDSTNAVRPGFTMSEKKVGDAFDLQFKGCDQRIIIASFSSNVDRIQQIIDVAAKYNRKVAISGRSMENIMAVATNQGYIHLPKDILIDLSDINRYPNNKLVIITTGSQGEPMSALYRMAFNVHKQVEVGVGDKIILAASPIPGNEKSVYKLINELMKKGADVVYEKMAEVHASGHACQEELKILLSLVKPRYFMPVHGEYRHLVAHAGLAKLLGIPSKNIFIGENGRPFEVSATGARFAASVPSGRVLVDGLGVGDVGDSVLTDRKRLSEDGLIVVAVAMDGVTCDLTSTPEIQSRGFVYAKNSDELLNQLRKIVMQTLTKCDHKRIRDWATIKSMIRDDLSGFLYKKTKKSPLILPIILETN